MRLPFGLGLPELVIILVIVVLVFGASRLSGIGGALGKGIREFRKGISGGDTGNDPKGEPKGKS